MIGKVTNPETDYAAYTAETGNGFDDTEGGQPDSSENSSDCVKSWSLDHSYLSQAVEKVIVLKFGYSEKATKFEKIFHIKFDATQ